MNIRTRDNYYITHYVITRARQSSSITEVLSSVHEVKVLLMFDGFELLTPTTSSSEWLTSYLPSELTSNLRIVVTGSYGQPDILEVSCSLFKFRIVF